MAGRQRCCGNVLLSSAEQHGLKECTELSQCQWWVTHSWQQWVPQGPEMAKLLCPDLVTLMRCTSSTRLPCDREQTWLQLTEADKWLNYIIDGWKASLQELSRVTLHKRTNRNRQLWKHQTWMDVQPTVNDDVVAEWWSQSPKRGTAQC